MQTNLLMRKGLIIGLVFLFAGTSTATMLAYPHTLVTKMEAKINLYDPSRDQIELKYYDENTLNNVIGIQGGTPPYIWKSAIRLTQTELSPYKTWNLTQVVIGFGEDPDEGPMNVTVFIYDKGTSTHPGNVIVDDTWVILTGTDLFTVPLTTPVSLTGHTEIWVAVEWTQNVDMTHYAFVDDGPAVDGKGDWIYLNSAWQEIQSAIDSNWAIGAIVEGNQQPNQPPNPPTIVGPRYGKINTVYTFSLGPITDPDGDQLYVLWDWGDGTTSGWVGPYNSGVTVMNTTHVWSNAGTYTIRVKLKDGYGAESEWSSFVIEIVELKKAFFLGRFENLSSTEDLVILKVQSLLAFPSNPIIIKGGMIAISKDYRGRSGKAFIIGVGGFSIL